MAGFAEIVLSPAFIIYPFLIFLLGNAIVFILNSVRPKAFPSGPRGIPVLGNLLQSIEPSPSSPIAPRPKYYGNKTPLGIKNGAINIVVLNSSRLVRELLERREAVYSDRPPQLMNNT